MKTGKVVTTFPIGEGVDANRFDPVEGKVFSSNGGSAEPASGTRPRNLSSPHFGPMMRYRQFLVAAALLTLCACGKPDADDKGAAKPTTDSTPGVTLSAEQVRSLGISTAPAIATTFHEQLSGYGAIVALDTVAQTDADFRTAQAAAAQSAAAAARARSLATGEEAAVSREVVETAQSKAAADQAALELTRRKTEAAFGRDAPWRDASSRQAIMARLASGRTVLVRVTFPLGASGNGPPASLQITRLGDNAKSWTATTVWNAPADASLPGRGFYALVDGSDLAQNDHVTATVPVGPSQSGVLVPANSLLYGESESWVYVQTKPGTYLRIKTDPSKAMGDGYFMPSAAGIHPGQPIVVNGAGLLLDRETNPSTQAAD